MAHHRHSRGARCRVVSIEGAADQRRHAEELETVSCHPGDVETLRAGIANPVGGVAAGRDDVLECGRLLLVVEVFRSGEVRSAHDPIRRVLEHDVHQPLGACIREGIEDDVADNAVDDGDRADPERERRRRHRREPGRSRQSTAAIDDVAAEIFDPLQEGSAKGRHGRFLGRKVDNSTGRSSV
jgi:hypothetical protein